MSIFLKTKPKKIDKYSCKAIKQNKKVETTLRDPIDALLDAAQNGKSIIKNREILHFTHIPNTIYYRDQEQKEITQSLLPILKHSRPSNLLVYGKPGTGKTLVIKKILKKIDERVKKTEFPIKLIYANAKVETTLYGLLVRFGLQLELTNKDLPQTGLATSEIFNRILNEINHKKTNIIFIIDEIDHLIHLISKTKNDVMYQLTRANDRLEGGSLTLVGISNDLTFKERLDPRVFSALGEEEIIFTNYTVEQLKGILDERAREAFTPDAVSVPALNLCAAMAGQEHGDARRAIDLLRVAGEAAEVQQTNKVTEEHVRTAAKKIEEKKETVVLRSYPLHEKLIILALMKSNGASTGEIYVTYKELSKTTRQKVLTQRRVTQILSEIAMSGIISGKITHQGIHGRTKKFTLAISPQTIKETFKDDVVLEDVL